MDLLNTLISWSLEDSIYTAQSMRARGYGVKKKRSFYFNYTFTLRDFWVSALLCLLIFMIICNLYIIMEIGVRLIKSTVILHRNIEKIKWFIFLSTVFV